MHKKTTNQTKINTMGSEVVDGYKCKPKVLEPNKPIMHYKNIIYICVDKRCSAEGSSKLPDDLRELVKKLNLDKSNNRIKIAKSLCYGACRYKQIATIYSNTQANKEIKHNNIWLKQVNKYDLQRWEKLFLLLKDDKDLDGFEQIKTKVYK